LAIQKVQRQQYREYKQPGKKMGVNCQSVDKDADDAVVARRVLKALEEIAIATLTPSSNQKVLAAREWKQRRAETAVMSASTPSSRGEVECACGRRQGARLTEDGASPEPVEGMLALSEGTPAVFTMMVLWYPKLRPSEANSSV
jgi:hypothetical protein